MKEVPHATREQAEFARLYEKALASYSFLTFVSVVPVPGDEDVFSVVVGGPRYLGDDTIKLGVAGVLHARKKVSPRRANHRFHIVARAGVAGAAARDEYLSSQSPLSALRKCSDGALPH